MFKHRCSTLTCAAVLEFTALNTVKHGGASIMIWGQFSYCGVGSIYHIPGIMDQSEYIKILGEVMVSLKWVFQ